MCVPKKMFNPRNGYFTKVPQFKQIDNIKNHCVRLIDVIPLILPKKENHFRWEITFLNLLTIRVIYVKCFALRHLNTTQKYPKYPTRSTQKVLNYKTSSSFIWTAQKNNNLSTQIELFRHGREQFHLIGNSFGWLLVCQKDA